MSSSNVNEPCMPGCSADFCTLAASRSSAVRVSERLLLPVHVLPVHVLRAPGTALPPLDCRPWTVLRQVRHCACYQCTAAVCGWHVSWCKVPV